MVNVVGHLLKKKISHQVRNSRCMHKYDAINMYQLRVSYEDLLGTKLEHSRQTQVQNIAK